MQPDAPHPADDERAAWQAPELTVLGSLASLTRANTVSVADIGGSGTLAGDSGTIL
jgi:hypothetical protein